MVYQIELPDSAEDISMLWEAGFKISTKIFTSPRERETITISSNKEGLISLARCFLLLAQPTDVVGQHFHFDEYDSLEKDSVELVVEKIM